MTTIESAGFFVAAPEDKDIADGAWIAANLKRRRGSADALSVQKLDAYILSDEASLLRQRAILSECDAVSPARAIAEATIAEYERALQALYRRRARLIADQCQMIASRQMLYAPSMKPESRLPG